jgi:N utilization substance protein A
MPKKKSVAVEEEEVGSLSGRLGDFGSAVMQIADEKGISREKILEIVEAALAAAYKKDYGKRGQVIRASFDEVTKETKYFLVKEVVDPSTRDFTIVEEPVEEEVKHNKHDDRRAPLVEVEEVVDEDRLPRYNAERDILVEDAQKLKKGAQLGDTVEIALESQDEFGRVAAQTAKQVIIQRVREAERESMFEEYKSREGEVVNGTIQRIEGRNVFLDLGKSVGVLFPSEQIEGENYRMGQHLKVLLVRVESDPKGPGLLLSRSHPDMVKHLFSLEVPEIYSGIVVVNAIAREAGSRTKIAVSTTQEGVDPIGSCVGQKGTRVQAVIDELGGEKIDIIEWNEDPKRFISAALSPAKVVSAELFDDENGKRAMVLVPADQLSLAIGKRGQNVRLAAKLTGWRIDVAAAEVPVVADSVSEESVGDDSVVSA